MRRWKLGGWSAKGLSALQQGLGNKGSRRFGAWFREGQEMRIKMGWVRSER